MPIEIGAATNPDEVMNAMGSLFNDTAQNIFNADYIGIDSRLAGGLGQQLKNVYYSTFTSDNAEVVANFEYDSINDLYNTTDWTTIHGSANYYSIDIYADSDDSISSGIPASNNSTLIRMREGIWRIYSIDTTQGKAKAQVIKSLYIDDMLSIFSNITALKTSDSDDVGMNFLQVTGSYSNGVDVNSNSTLTGTFTDTSNNTRISSWSAVTRSQNDAGTMFCRWELPSGTILNSKGASGGTASDFGVDTSADDAVNSSDCQIEFNTGNTDGGKTISFDIYIGFQAGSINFVESLGANWSGSFSTNDISQTYPDLTLEASSLEDTSFLIFKDTTVDNITNAITVINSQIDATSSEQISISANGGSDYTDVNNTEIARLTAGTELWRKIVITRTDLSKEDKVTEQAIKYNLY